MKLTGEIVKEYLLNPLWENLPSHTLAKKIFNENKSVFKHVETVRSAIKYYRGAAGDTHRKKLNDTRFIDYNPHKLPATEETDYFHYIVPAEVNNILVLSDIHVPYHSIEAVNAAIDYGLKHNINGIILNGDIWDCYQASRFNPDPRKRSLFEEREAVKEFLQALNEIFPNVWKMYKLGNHEERWEKYFIIKAPEILDMPEFRIEEILDLKNLGYHYQTCDKQIIKAGSLNIVHGHEFGGSVFSPVNVARGLFLRAKTSAICGHHHQTSEHTESNMNGKITTTWSQGCLSELHPNYLPINKWNHGFSHIKTHEKEFEVHNIRIVDGRIV